jgi:two-component system response regulator AdeR
MAVRFSCPCGQRLKTADEVVGKRAKCPKCGQWLRVPESDTYRSTADVSAPRPLVVVADSKPTDLASLSDILRQHGYKVVKATNGAEAIDVIRAKEPDACILDVRLEGLSGFQVAEQIHNPANPKNEKVWTTPVLMTSEKLRGRDKQYSMSKGVKAFFTKPIVPAQLCHRLQKVIRRRAEGDAASPSPPVY